MYNKTDRFHQLFPDHGEPKLPILIYNNLLDRIGADAAFTLLCRYEKGAARMSDIARYLAAD